jgi:acetyl/propionyl-CoA carboxylase alpha subunit
MEYDPLLAKLIVWAPSETKPFLGWLALDETHIEGIKTNISFLREIVEIRIRGGSATYGIH